MLAITIFSFGYWGWGNETSQLVNAVDVVEAARGFKSPLFVDIRISRSVRAVGFNGSAFEKMLGPARHRWMKGLGNRAILEGGQMTIADPHDADVLLDLAIANAREKRRLLFFCSCKLPIGCHRRVVAGLVKGAATRRGLAVEIVEWPGGSPECIQLDLADKAFKAVINGRSAIPFENTDELSKIAGLPWCTVAQCRGDGEQRLRIVGPAIRRGRHWCLPVLSPELDPMAPIEAYKHDAEKMWNELGYMPQV